MKHTQKKGKTTTLTNPATTDTAALKEALALKDVAVPKASVKFNILLLKRCSSEARATQQN